MANEYLYGAYGRLGQTIARNAIQAGTVPVYVGTAPVNLIRVYKKFGIINTPVKLSNLPNAQQTVGYSEKWDKFTLCEAVSAHFDNTLGNIGPVYVINVLDPDINRKAQGNAVNVSLVFSNGQATIKSDMIILDTLALEGLAEDTDYSVDYNFTNGTVILRSIGTEKISGTVAASYLEVDLDGIDVDTIIGGVTADGEYSGLGALQLLYQEQYQVCDLLMAPGWSHIPKVYNAMLKAAEQINGHWDAFVLADIPLKTDEDGGAVSIETISAAKEWKKQNGYTSERSKVFWPKGRDNSGKVYHLSTLAAVEFMRIDYTHASVPFETCGNKQIPITRQYFGEASKNRGFDQITSKELTSDGISTCVFWGGNWVLWGDHTAAYTYGADVDPRAIFDVSMRMLFYITNSFQREWGTTIDEPFTKQLRDRIINREQEKLDALVAQGALIGNPSVLFLESNNSTEDMMNGDFRWDIPVTPTPPLKSATVYVAYTDAGFSAYFNEEG
ncbi:MAG: phage tail sheath family protein [Lachnospiraceae bacterium]|nr:phage tail sheath family protein [Lachnospiraceae bacterium]MDE7204066.1 phage tail sheath family protein [Lachnospiraceae bacterium]